MSTQEQKVNTPDPNDFASNLIRSAKKPLLMIFVYLGTMFSASLVNIFFPVPIIFIILYLLIIVLVLSVVGVIDSYTQSNILTGFGVAFGLLLIDPKNFISSKMVPTS